MVNTNWPTLTVAVEFVPGTWTDITGRVKSLTGNRGRQYEQAAAQAGTMTLAVDNADGALDPTNTTSPYYPNVKLFRRIRTQLTWAGVTKTLWTGFVERYPQSYGEAGNYQWTNVVAVDVLAQLSHNTLESAYTEAVKALHPSVWYPLSDASGSNNKLLRQAGGAVAGERAAGLPPGVFFTPGGDPITATLGSASSAAVGEEGQTVADFTAPPANPYSVNGTLLNLPQSVALPTSGPWTILFNFTAKAGSAGGYLLSIGDEGQGFGVSRAYITLSINTVNFVLFQVLGAGGAPGILQNIPLSVGDGLPHTFALTLAADNNTFRLLYDGTRLFTFTYGGVYAPAPSFQISLGGQYRPRISQTVGCYSGMVSNFCLFPSELVTAAAPYGPAGALAQVYFQGYAGDTTRGRFNRAAGFAGLTAINSTAEGNSTMQHAKIKGKTVLQALQDTAAAENGSLFVDGDGVLWFVNRQNRNNRAASYTLGDTSGYPYLGLTTDYDATHVVNDVTVARDNGVTAHVINQASIDAYRRRTQSTTTEIQDDYQTIDAANYILGIYSEPVRRISSISLDPAANPALWPLITSLELNQAVTVIRTPMAGVPFTRLCFVESVAYTIAAGVFTVSLLLSPADSHHFLRLDDPVYGRLDAGNALTY